MTRRAVLADIRPLPVVPTVRPADREGLQPLADYADALVRSTKDNPTRPDAVEPFSEDEK